MSLPITPRGPHGPTAVSAVTHSSTRGIARFIALAMIATGLAGCGRAGPPPMPPAEVTVSKPLVRQVTDWDEYTGRLAAVESVEVRARVSGYLEAVHFEDGTLVQKGDLLFVIDPRPYQAARDEAQAQLSRARIRLDLAVNDLDRAQRLYESRAISEEEFDARTQERKEAQAAIEAAEAAVQATELDLAFSRVRAPISGRIGRKLVTEGNLITGGATQSTLLTTIVSVDPMHVYFTADERAYLRYQRMAQDGLRPSSRDAANPVRIQLADEESFQHEGLMDFVDNVVDLATGTMQGRAVIPNPDGVLTPGLFARVQLLGEGPYKALLVPDMAIGTDQAQRLVWVLNDDDTVRPQPVTLGRAVGPLRVIREGLEQDDRVVINGLQRVRPGAPVTPVAGEIPEPPAGSMAGPATAAAERLPAARQPARERPEGG